jgi:DNA-binding transcriptional MocR family regulator
VLAMSVRWETFKARRGATPVYKQLAGWIADRISAGDLQPGDQIPAERRLADLVGVSVDTVRSAMAALRDEGLIETGHGTGSFVLLCVAVSGECPYPLRPGRPHSGRIRPIPHPSRG